MTAFTDFTLNPLLLKALAGEGYTIPTPIQAQTIPLALAGRDIVGIAQTGTGKTAAFALPILDRLMADPKRAPLKSARVLVLAPTRELAAQIAESFSTYGRHARLSVTCVYGGMPLGKQEKALAPGVDILVATPGRLLDHIDRRSLTLRDVEHFVLDEADQMMDLGFIHALKRIAGLLPTKRQTLFFSATMPKAIAALAAEFLTNPAQVAVAPVATTAERVEQHVVHMPVAGKQAVLDAFARSLTVDRALVFTRTKHGADKVTKRLEMAGVSAAAIHGNKSQGQRERALSMFRNGTCKFLVATDIAARGIDVDGVSHVFNFDLPNIPESYVHRIGRTARAGAAGIAISFCAGGEDRGFLRDIERLIRARIPEMAIPEGVDLKAPPAVIPYEEPHRDPRARPEHRRQQPRSEDRGAPRRTEAPRPVQTREERRPERLGEDFQQPQRRTEPRREEHRHEPRRANPRRPEPRREDPQQEARRQEARREGTERKGASEGRTIGWIAR